MPVTARALALALALGACSIPQEEFPDEAAESWCKRADNCGLLDISRAECEADLGSVIDLLLDGATALGAEYEGSGGAACVREIKSLSCDELEDWQASSCELFADDE